jgi:3-isopropylmalate dehydrogenase
MFRMDLSATVPGWIDPDRRPPAISVVMGEGIGPEVMGAALDVLDAVTGAFGRDLEVARTDHLGTVGPWGLGVDEEAAAFVGAALAADTPVLTGPAGGRFVYELRATFDLYAKVIPVLPMTELADASIVRPGRIEGTDIVIVRDNVAGLYQGGFGFRDDGRTAWHDATYSADGVDRLLAVAAAIAADRQGRLAVVTKPGGIPAISALWADRARAHANSGIEIDIVEVDNACYQMVADPRRFDVVAAPNLIGDVLGDTAALLLGSRGMALSMNIGDGGRAVYQTGHGAAHDLAGRNVANPVAQIQSMALLLHHSLGWHDEADAVLEAVRTTLADGWRTRDIAAAGSNVVGTRELGQRIADRVAVGVAATSER